MVKVVRAASPVRAGGQGGKARKVAEMLGRSGWTARSSQQKTFWQVLLATYVVYRVVVLRIRDVTVAYNFSYPDHPDHPDQSSVHAGFKNGVTLTTNSLHPDHPDHFYRCYDFMGKKLR
jgi:hypothetical protein